jgi:hypothetical protein
VEVGGGAGAGALGACPIAEGAGIETGAWTGSTITTRRTIRRTITFWRTGAIADAAGG